MLRISGLWKSRKHHVVDTFRGVKTAQARPRRIRRCVCVCVCVWCVFVRVIRRCEYARALPLAASCDATKLAVPRTSEKHPRFQTKINWIERYEEFFVMAPHYAIGKRRYWKIANVKNVWSSLKIDLCSQEYPKLENWLLKGSILKDWPQDSARRNYVTLLRFTFVPLITLISVRTLSFVR